MTDHERPMPPVERIEIEAGEGLTLKTLLIDDAEEYFEQIDSDRDYFSQFNDETAEKYPDVGSVVRSIVYPNDPERKRFAIREEGVLVGTINLTPSNGSAEAGYWIGPTFTNKGYATRALEAVTDWAFGTAGFNRIYAFVRVGNDASRRVLEKAGYKYTGTLTRKKDEEWRFELAKP